MEKNVRDIPIRDYDWHVERFKTYIDGMSKGGILFGMLLGAALAVGKIVYDFMPKSQGMDIGGIK